MKTIIARFAPIPPRPSNTPKGKEVGMKQPRQPLQIAKAVEVLDTSHPLNAGFAAWLKGKPATKREAREFCRLMGRKVAAKVAA